MPVHLDLPPVIWVGGGSGAGKTTVSRAIAHRNDLVWYRIDAHGYEHRDRLAARDRIGEDDRSHDERWLQPSAAELADDFVQVSADLITLIIEDLHTMDHDVGVVVEGPQLFPELVAPHLGEPDHAVWLIPSADFRRQALEGRSGGVHNLTSDPAAALQRLLDRNLLLDERIQDQAASVGGVIIDVDGDRDRDLPTMIDYVQDQLSAALRKMPRFSTGRQRRQIRISENDAMVQNVRAFMVDAKLDRPPGPLPFACECDTLGCDVIVERPLTHHESARASADPISGH